MKQSKKYLIAVMSVVMIFTSLAAPTYSWLSSKSEKVVNTFSGGSISVIVDEAQVDPDGKKIVDGERVTSNNYKYTAGSVLDKDPTPTVLKGSDPCYVFLCVENELNNLFSINIDTESWINVANENDKAVYIYYTTVDAENADDDIVLNPIFTQVAVSQDLTQDDVAELGETTLNVTAYAIQTEALSEKDAIDIASAQFFSNNTN